MSDFKGNKKHYLRKGDTKIDYSYEHTDSFLPEGLDIQSVTVSGTDKYGTPVSSFIVASSVEDNVVTVRHSYPTEGAGTYHLKFYNDLGNGIVKTSRFNRVVATED